MVVWDMDSTLNMEDGMWIWMMGCGLRQVSAPVVPEPRCRIEMTIQGMT